MKRTLECLPFVLLLVASQAAPVFAAPCAPGCRPMEAQVLNVTHNRLSGVTTLTWAPDPSGVYPNSVFDVLRASERTGITATCLAADLPIGAGATDATSPSRGTSFYYLIRGRNLCGESPADSSGWQALACAPRTIPSLNTGLEPPHHAADGESIASLPRQKDTGDVHLHSGEYALSHVDLWIPGRGFDFVWERTYRSREGRMTAMGQGWDFSYNARIEIPPGAPADRWLYDGHGRRDTYTPVAGGCWSAVGFFRELCAQPNGTYTLTFPDMTVWTFRGFDLSTIAGKIQEIRDRNFNVMTFFYQPVGRLSAVTDTLGRQITVGYNTGGFIASLTDFGGRQVTYSYYSDPDPNGSSGDLKSWTTPAVTGTPNGNDFPLGKTTTYTYSRGMSDPALNHNLLTVTDPLGAVIVQNYYTPTAQLFDRLTGQGYPSGFVADYFYQGLTPSPVNHFATMKTIVNDRAGNVREAFFDASDRLVALDEYTGRAPEPTCPTDGANNRSTGRLRPDDPALFETLQEHNADHQVTRVIRPNGGVIQYRYESDLNPGGPRRSQGNLREIHRLPGPLGGDQAEIVEVRAYDTTFNFIAEQTDGRGNTTLHGYDVAGNRIHLQHRIPSIVEDWEYNGFGQMTAHILPDNGSNHRRRDEYTNYSSGAQRGYLKDEIVDAGTGGLALTTTFEYDAVGNVVRRIDPRGNDTLFSVNALNQVVQEQSRETAPGSGVRYLTRRFFDAADRIVQEDIQNRDENGTIQSNAFFTTTYQFDALDRATREDEEVDPTSALPEEYQYDPNDHLLLTREGEAVGGGQIANTEKTLYDERDLTYLTVLAEGDPDQSATQTDYDADGNLRAVRQGIGSLPRVTTFAYDGYGRRIRRTDPMGNVTSLHYDANGNVVSERLEGELHDVPGSAGNVRLSEMTYVYDEMDRRTRTDIAFFDPQTQGPIGDGLATTETSYAGTSDVLSVTDDNGHVTVTAYDSANRKLTVTDALGNSTSWTRDANGNILSRSELEVSDVGGLDQIFDTDYAYDGLDRRIQETDNVGNIRRYAYDSRANRVKVIDALDRETRSTFDGAKRRLTVAVDMDDDGASALDSQDIVTSQAWDRSSRLIAQTDDNGHTTSQEYDELDRPISEDMADCTEPTTIYDAHGNRISETDANGTVVTYTYDLLDRVASKSIAPGPGVSTATTTETFQYDGMSRIVQATNDDTGLARQYDSLGRLTRETQSLTSVPGSAATIVSVYDGVGNRTSCTYPGGRTVATTYDALNREKVISDGSGVIATYDYVGPSRVERRSNGNGTRSIWSYDGIAPNPPDDSGVRQVVRTTHTHTVSGTVLDDRTYLWDGDGNKWERKDVRAGGPQFTHVYYMDAANRLSDVFVLDASNALVRGTSYFMDGAGNRLSVTGLSAPDAGSYSETPVCPVADFEMNQYTTTPMNARVYDENGNLKTLVGQADLTYDYANRMVQYDDLFTGQRHTYAYDPLGRRVEKIVDADGVAGGPHTTRFLLDSLDEIEERDGAGATQATYVFSRTSDEMLNMRRAGADWYYHADDLHSATALSDVTGTIVERYDYGDFGQPLDPGTLAPQPTPSGFGNSALFTGRRYDDETGLYYFRTRYLDPRAGRFTTRDTLGVWGDALQGGNPYTYVANNPFSMLDPLGRGTKQALKQLKEQIETAKKAKEAGDKFKKLLEDIAKAEEDAADDDTDPTVVLELTSDYIGVINSVGIVPPGLDKYLGFIQEAINAANGGIKKIKDEKYRQYKDARQEIERVNAGGVAKGANIEDLELKLPNLEAGAPGARKRYAKERFIDTMKAAGWEHLEEVDYKEWTMPVPILGLSSWIFDIGPRVPVVWRTNKRYILRKAGTIIPLEDWR